MGKCWIVEEEKGHARVNLDDEVFLQNASYVQYPSNPLEPIQKLFEKYKDWSMGTNKSWPIGFEKEAWKVIKKAGGK